DDQPPRAFALLLRFELTGGVRGQIIGPARAAVAGRGVSAGGRTADDPCAGDGGDRLGGVVDGAEHGGSLGIGAHGHRAVDQLGFAAGDHGGDVPGEGDGTGVAPVAVLGQAREDHRVHRRGDRRVVRGGGQVLLAHVLVGDRDRGVTGERRPPRQKLVHHAGGGVDVRAGIDQLTACLLGGEVLGGAHHGLGGGHGAGGVRDRPGDAEVHHLHVAGVV